MGSTLLTPLYLPYRRAFGFSEITLTLIYAVYVVGNIGALFFFGRLSDQIGRRRTSLPAIVLAGIATLIFLFAHATAWLFVARVLSGLAIGIASGTATAWIAELAPGGDKEWASALAATANLFGSGVGPLLAGLLAEFAPAPLQTTWLVYLAALALVAWPVASLSETVQRPVGRVRDLSFRVRLGVPRGIRTAFVAPAVAAFATFALIGYYAALAPSLLSVELGLTSPAIGGAIVAELFLVAAATVVATRRARSRTALLWGIALLVPSIGVLLLAQSFASLALLVIGTTIGGFASALGYRGTLQVVNGIAPPDQRAEVISSYMIAVLPGQLAPRDRRRRSLRIRGACCRPRSIRRDDLRACRDGLHHRMALCAARRLKRIKGGIAWTPSSAIRALSLK
jgi:predicted MFS family arabinose efflux permease